MFKQSFTKIRLLFKTLIGGGAAATSPTVTCSVLSDRKSAGANFYISVTQHYIG